MKLFGWLPLCVVIFLPKSWQDRHLRDVWEARPDEVILYAYEDCNEWMNIGIESIRASSEKRMNEIIIPEMERRGLEKPPLRSLQARADEYLIDVYMRKYPHISF